jgi:DNA modification methylase
MTLYDQPDLAEFIQEHSTPYDPETDTYRRPPFAQPVKAGKNSAIYNAHSYHTKVPPEGIVPYIEHYTDPGDLVLDPFCGSGMTGVAALMTGRYAILNDLSPAAVHIAYNYCTPVDVKALKREFQRIQTAAKEEFDWLYGTTCDRCGGPATIQYTIWSDVFECARCGGAIVLWDAAVDQDTSKVTERFACPTCQAAWKKTNLCWLRSIPVTTSYECPHCKPRRAEHPTTPTEKQRIAEIDAAEIPYWYPTTPFDESWEMWRAAHRYQGITDVSRLYTRRNLWAASRLWSEMHQIADDRVRNAVKFTLTSSFVLLSKLTRYNFGRRGNGPVSGTLYVASFTAENNAYTLVEGKVNDCIRYWDNLNTPYAVLASTDSATCLPHDLGSQIDYIFTDPPFGSNIFYADCNLIWEAWLDHGLTDQTQEAVVHLKHKDKNTLPDYARLMTGSFSEMYRVLKPGRWASVVFHNSDDRIWQVILDAAETAGFELAEINAFDKVQLSFKGIRGDKGLERVTNQDIVLNLHKPRRGQAPVPNGRTHLAACRRGNCIFHSSDQNQRLN